MHVFGGYLWRQEGQEKIVRVSPPLQLCCDDCGVLDLHLQPGPAATLASCEPCITSRKHSLEHFNLLLCVSLAFFSAPGREEWRRASPSVSEWVRDGGRGGKDREREQLYACMCVCVCRGGWWASWPLPPSIQIITEVSLVWSSVLSVKLF